jgi:hypothetical protein
MEQWDHNWKINHGPSGMVNNGTPSEIRLLKHAADGITFFEVKVEGGHMDPAWDGLRLFPRGNQPLPWQGEKLEPFGAAQVFEYRNRINAHLAITSSATNRLEGELNSGGTPKSVYLFLARDAVKTGADLSDLLIVNTDSMLVFTKPPAEGSPVANPAVVSPIEDGTGHGNKT